MVVFKRYLRTVPRWYLNSGFPGHDNRSTDRASSKERVDYRPTCVVVSGSKLYRQSDVINPTDGQASKRLRPVWFGGSGLAMSLTHWRFSNETISSPICKKMIAFDNFAEHLPERRRMMQTWADYLDGLQAGGELPTGGKS